MPKHKDGHAAIPTCACLLFSAWEHQLPYRLPPQASPPHLPRAGLHTRQTHLHTGPLGYWGLGCGFLLPDNHHILGLPPPHSTTIPPFVLDTPMGSTTSSPKSSACLISLGSPSYGLNNCLYFSTCGRRYTSPLLPATYRTCPPVPPLLTNRLPPSTPLPLGGELDCTAAPALPASSHAASLHPTA